MQTSSDRSSDDIWNWAMSGCSVNGSKPTVLPSRCDRPPVERHMTSACSAVAALHHSQGPVYIGRIRHGEKTYAGKYDPIIEQDMFEATRTRLAVSTNGKRFRSGGESPSLLASNLFDENGQPLVATHAIKPVVSGGAKEAKFAITAMSAANFSTAVMPVAPMACAFLPGRSRSWRSIPHWSCLPIRLR